jgi:hypothetical protein
VDWKSYDHLVVTIMSHGIHERFITSDCRDFQIEEIVAIFSGKKNRAVGETQNLLFEFLPWT